ncbi:MAG: indole-3-glycerol-phosphate synthase [Desulfovibrio sp.]|nr:indole-3-glycerol-phosphate synthase [Desulfovibrio sp.]
MQRLERIIEGKGEELAELRRLERTGAFPPPLPGVRPDFAGALAMPSPGADVAVIAEYKRASPSRGVIRSDLSVEDVCAGYARAGARAISVLTEERHFRGSPDFLGRAAKAEGVGGVPLLRKDFLTDPLQVRATAATPAAALLLIVRLTPDAGTLASMRELAEGFGMQAVVEVFDGEDLVLARDSGAGIIQVNARDLETLSVDVGACLALAERHPPGSGETWIAASGITEGGDLRRAADAGFRAVLVGTWLMERGCPGDRLAELLKGAGRGERPGT